MRRKLLNGCKNSSLQQEITNTVINDEYFKIIFCRLNNVNENEEDGADGK